MLDCDYSLKTIAQHLENTQIHLTLRKKKLAYLPKCRNFTLNTLEIHSFFFYLMVLQKKVMFILYQNPSLSLHLRAFE